MRLKRFVEQFNYTVYCDMDGVLCDFGKAFDAIGGKDAQVHRKLTKADWKLLDDAGEDFWTYMPWMPDGKKLWEYLKQYTTHILSSPTRDPRSRSGKKKWCKRELGNVQVFLSNNKGTFANPFSILVDDKKENIEDWIKNGGIGILHKSANETIKTLKEIDSLLEKIEKLREEINNEVH